MWVLDVLESYGGVVKITLPVLEGTYTIGRKDASIGFGGDRCVSRCHAELRVGSFDGSDPSQQPVWVKDVGSKFKTFVNDKDTGEAGVEVTLKDGDLVRVGNSMASVVRLRYKPLRLCGTRLPRESTRELREFSRKAGATIVKQWDAQCTHLISPQGPSKVTEKLLLALTEGKAAVHTGWPEALVCALSARPLPPVPETASFATTVMKKSGGTMVVTENPARRSHLDGELFVLLLKDEGFERIAEAVGAQLCRAYTMKDDEFSRQNWKGMAAGRRRAFYVQPLASDVLEPGVLSAASSRGSRLGALGLEATTKMQLAEAVVYLKPMMALNESEDASVLASQPGEGHVQLGPTQSQPFLSQAMQASHATGGTVTAQADGASAPMPPPAPPGDRKRSPITSVPMAEIPQVADKRRRVGPAVSEVTNLAGKKTERRADANSSGVPDGGVKGRSEGSTGVAGGISPPDAKEASTSAAEKTGGDEGQGAGHGRATERGGGGDLQSKRGSSVRVGAVAETMGGVEDALGNLDAGRKPVKREREEMNGCGEAQGPNDQVRNTGNEISSPREGNAASRAGSDGVSSEGGEVRGSWDEGGRPAKRRKEEASREDDDRRNYARGEETNGGQLRQLPVSFDGEVECTARECREPSPGRGKGGADLVLSPGPPPSPATGGDASENIVGEGSLMKVEAGQRNPRVSHLPDGGGWMTAGNSLGRGEQRGAGGRVRKEGRDRKRGGDSERGVSQAVNWDADRDTEISVTEGMGQEVTASAPLERAVTEMRRLVARVHIQSTGQSSTPLARRNEGGQDPPLTNFKRFRKNAVLFGGEGLGEYIPLSTLRPTVPKESERELGLAAEQQRIEKEEAEAERLFSQDIRGRGRTIRR